MKFGRVSDSGLKPETNTDSRIKGGSTEGDYQRSRFRRNLFPRC